MKYIVIEKCGTCPWFFADFMGTFCNEYDRVVKNGQMLGVDPDTIDPACPLEEYEPQKKEES